MPRPGMLTRSRANRMVKTPGGRRVIHRRKNYRAGGVCAVSGDKIALSKKTKHGLSRKASLSRKRPNRPYGGKVSSKAVRRGITRQVRDL
ncbi:MAG: 50S ribosomal protein L34e [Candidatus Thorarchaeota archaeon]|nr:50S ribosomal protein L34e [Candidatus Thorarchaeota archaeon]